MRRTPLIGAAAAASLLFTLTACGGGDDKLSENEVRDQLSDTFQAGDDGLPKEQADCLTDIIIEEVGIEKLQDVDLTSDEPPEEIQEEITAATLRAFEECDLAGG